MNTPAIVSLPRSLTNQMLHHAQSDPAQEVCGLVGAKNNTPCSIYPITNKASDPTCRFQLDEAEQIQAMQTMRTHQETLFAIYHSHPQGTDSPSSLDIEMASYPEAIYLIISLGTKGVLKMQGFRINNGHSHPVKLNLTESA
jgi:proteasome lid subunit RPN8/RPN11